jgi:cephalosporin hydroxylase
MFFRSWDEVVRCHGLEFPRIEMIEGPSIAPEIVTKVHKRAAGCERVLVALD